MAADPNKIAEDKKRFILDVLNPMLEEMVAEAIAKMPPDPVPFMLDFLETKRIEKEDKLLTEDEKERLKQENEELKENMTKVKAEMQETAKLVQQSKEEEDEEEDDEDDEPPPDFFKERPNNTARASVSAEAYGEWNTKKAFVAPMIPKSEEQKQRLKSCLQKSFLFSTLGQNDLMIVIGAMKEVAAEAKQRIINQGDNGDFLFVIESGVLDCIIKDKTDGKEKTVKTCEPGDVFGELALLYNCPRAASVEARQPCVLWQLDRDTFNNIVKEAAQKKRERYDAFLQKVPLLAGMDSYERSQLADALKSEEFAAGTVICKEGANGDSFYIIEEGTATATKAGAQVMNYAPGDYFGELALLRNQPRAATVTAKDSVSLLTLDSRSFKRLLDVSALLERSDRYTK